MGHRTELERSAEALQHFYSVELKAFLHSLKTLVTSRFAGAPAASHQVQVFADGRPIFAGLLKDNEFQKLQGQLTPAHLHQLRAMANLTPGQRIGSPQGTDLNLQVNQTPILTSQGGFVQTNEIPSAQRSLFSRVAPPTPELAQVSQSTPPPESSPIVILQQSLPPDSPLHKLVHALKQSAHHLGNLCSPTQRSFAQDLRNLHVLEKAQVCLALLGTGPAGQRTWAGQTYQFQETGNQLTITAKGRGTILQFDRQAGQIVGQTKPQDLENLQALLTFAQARPPQPIAQASHQTSLTR